MSLCVGAVCACLCVKACGAWSRADWGMISVGPLTNDKNASQNLSLLIYKMGMTRALTFKVQCNCKSGSFSHPNSKPLRSTYYVLATIPSTGDTTEPSKSLPWQIQR